MIETIILCAIFGAFIMYAFIKGIQIDQKISNNGTVEIMNPIKIIKEHRTMSKANKDSEKEMKEIETMLENIDNYDGTGLGQKEI